ncbi:MAG TPA: YciI family protein [Rhodanobacteraceae bacterium]|nr:YciI family protein [Rhodanobacteraceae bacterium]
MTYLLLVMEPHGQRQARSVDEGRQVYERMTGFAGELDRRGVLRACESLKSDAEGVRVQERGGKRSLLDGPFAESKEMVGGFFLIDCDTREQAVAIAAQCPAAQWATVEVREVGPCYL